MTRTEQVVAAACTDGADGPKSFDGSKRFKCAVAEGLAGKAFSGRWAEFLVNGFCHDDSDGLGESALANARQLWSDHASGFLVSESTQNEIEGGSEASFVGVSLSGSGYHASSIGGCGLFQIRDSKLVAVCPSNPVPPGQPGRYISSKNLPVSGSVHSFDGTIEAGDLFLLMSTALAARLRGREDAGDFEKVLAQLAEIETNEEFSRFVECESSEEQSGTTSLACDDALMVRLRVEKVVEDAAPEEKFVRRDQDVSMQPQPVVLQVLSQDGERRSPADEMARLAAIVQPPPQPAKPEDIRSMRQSQIKAERTMDAAKTFGWLMFIASLIGIYFMFVRLYGGH